MPQAFNVCVKILGKFLVLIYVVLCPTVSLERWCRLRGNLLFYFKSREQWSEPLGVIILEQCSIKVDTPTAEGPYGFHLGE